MTPREPGREPEMVIPLDRLPPGFAERVAEPPATAATPRPAATAVLARDGAEGPELLLLKRHRSAGFVPGAWVFPGGRVDDDDAAPELIAMLDPHPAEPPAAYWLAAIREVFEETGVLLGREAEAEAEAEEAGSLAGGGAHGSDAGLSGSREALLSGGATLLDVFRDLRVRPDLTRMVYCAHWITPVAEPRRYDTRFFLAALPAGSHVTIDEREMSDMLWLRPDDALARFRAGELPMVFPTIKTIQRLAAYPTVDAMLAHFRAGAVEPILPRLVRTEEGIGIVLPY